MEENIELLKENSRKNVFGIMGFFLLLLTLFICELVLKFLFGYTNLIRNISLVGYILSIGLGILSFVQDNDDQKKGYKPVGATNFATLSIFIGIYLIVSSFIKF